MFGSFFFSPDFFGTRFFNLDENGTKKTRRFEEREAEAPVVPRSMVTHNWTNSFVNLVAAMVADALGGAGLDV